MSPFDLAVHLAVHPTSPPRRPPRRTSPTFAVVGFLAYRHYLAVHLAEPLPRRPPRRTSPTFAVHRFLAYRHYLAVHPVIVYHGGWAVVAGA